MSRPSAVLAALALASALGSGLGWGRGGARGMEMGVRTRFRDALAKRLEVVQQPLDDAALKEGIAGFYDESSSIWIDVWGEHMHHGYYPPGFNGFFGTMDEHRAAQEDMIERSLAWAYGPNASPPRSMVDVGCGVGGSSRYINRKWGCTTEGLSLSPYQIDRAKQMTEAAGQEASVNFQVADAMAMPFANDSFDFAWSMESGEHMPDKEKFVRELVRVTAPGGRILIVTWCHRELKPKEEKLKRREQQILAAINKAYFLPEWCAVSKYEDIATSLGLEDVRTADWSEAIAPFWGAVTRSALRPRNFLRLIRTGHTTFKGAVATLLMRRGFRIGLVKFVLVTARVPEAKKP